ncbi:MAG: hypothetical protein NTW86_21295 [Candidatus Sumerlaeota bacterium]|nr:hypothetical protein [Candidatus Sumerlaeota bacterium]
MAAEVTDIPGEIEFVVDFSKAEQKFESSLGYVRTTVPFELVLTPPKGAEGKMNQIVRLNVHMEEKGKALNIPVTATIEGEVGVDPLSVAFVLSEDTQLHQMVQFRSNVEDVAVDAVRFRDRQNDDKTYHLGPVIAEILPPGPGDAIRMSVGLTDLGVPRFKGGIPVEVVLSNGNHVEKDVTVVVFDPRRASTSPGASESIHAKS